MATTPTKRVHRVGTPADKAVKSEEVVESEESNEYTLYDALRESLAKKVEVEDYPLTVPNRPEMELVYKPNFEFDQFQEWNRRCTNKKTDEVDFLKLSIIVISHTNVGIRLSGQPVNNPDTGEAMLITSKEIHQMLGAPIGGTGAALRKLYASDGHIIQTCRKIVEKAGYSMDGDVIEGDEGPLDL